METIFIMELETRYCYNYERFTLYGGIIPYGGTFNFSDYCKPSIRLSALMGLKVIYVFSHDSIGLGEDGPTHQPIEQLAGLRAIPNLNVFRPADINETLNVGKLFKKVKTRQVRLHYLDKKFLT